ncbi:MAG: pyrroline-5-carboxylate reductase [Betaproteobacteria bacterium HGW-Betaproteobacteria-22]|nr:MAG: pyrroline-5-carboxylate reductase [Betaproteobacteria bacterium HGW-Betaproteobacteria-22]
MKIHFIGGGNMARAIITGLKQNNFNTSTITVLELDIQKRRALAAELNVQVTDTYAEFSNTDVIVLAVKPQQLKAVCTELKPIVKSQLLISIAAGVRIADIARWLGDYRAIVRVMPNTPAQIQAGISALSAGDGVSQAQRIQAESILAAVGKTLWLESEAQMDAVTAISGSGPAYVFYFIEALQDAAMQLGLNANTANLLALHTVAGASLLATQSRDDIKTLRAQVTSKGGTTEQGVLALESANFKDIIFRAAKAAEEKSALLGDQLAQ